MPQQRNRPAGGYEENKAVSRLLGHSDEATTLRYYVQDAFSEEELFGEVK